MKPARKREIKVLGHIYGKEGLDRANLTGRVNGKASLVRQLSKA